MKINKQNFGWVIVIILVLVILGYSGKLYFDSQTEKGIGIGQEQVIIQINQQSSIPIILQEDNKISVEWVDIQEVCGSLQNENNKSEMKGGQIK